MWFLLHTKEITGQVLFTESDFGLFTMLSFILSMTSVLGVVALPSASTRFISYYLARGEIEEAKSIVTRILQVAVVTSAIISSLLLILASVLSDVFSRSVLIFQFLSCSVAIQIFYVQAQGFLRGLQKLREFAILGVFYTVVQYSIAILLVYAGFEVLGITVSWLFALIFSCSIAIFVTSRHLRFSRKAHELKPLLVFSLPIYVSALLNIVVGWVDQIFVFPFLGIEALGVYNLAVRASVVPNLVSVALVTSLFPKLSELFSSFGVKSLREAFKTATRYAAFLGFPVSLLIATLAYPIIVLFATVRFVDAVVPLAVMCVASIPLALGSAINPTLLTLERTKTAASISLFSILLEALLAYVSLAHIHAGLVGVAFSRLLAALATFILGAYILRILLNVEFDRDATWKSAAASTIMVLSLLALELLRTMTEPSYKFLVLRLRQLPVYAAVGVAVYIISLIMLRAVKKRDIELLRDFLPSFLRRFADFFDHVAHPRE